MELSPSTSSVRLVNPAMAEMSDMEFPSRFSPPRLVNPAMAEMSDMGVVLKSQYCQISQSSDDRDIGYRIAPKSQACEIS